MRIHLKEEFFLVIILFIATVLRFYNLAEMSLMNDELSMLSRTNYASFAELISKGVIPDVHPAGVQVFIFYWIKLFGNSVFAIRFPFAICGILSVFLIFKIGTLWFSKTTGLVAAASLAILQFPLLYSQLIRMYSLGLFTTLVFTFYWTRIFFSDLNGKNSKLIWKLCYILSAAASMYLHYFALMLVGIIGLTGLFFIRKSDFKIYILLNGIAVLLFIPHIKIFLSQLAQGGVGGPGGWLSVPDQDTFLNYINNFFNDSWLYYVIPIITVGSYLIFSKQVKFGRFHLFAILFYVTPFAIGYTYSVLRNPVLQMPGMLFSFPYLLLFLFSCFPVNFNNRIGLSVAAFILMLLFSTLVDKRYFSTYHFGEYKDLANLTIKFNKDLESKNITQVINIQNPSYINYYFDQLNSQQHFALYNTSDDSGCAQLLKVVEKSDSPYFLYAFTNVYNPPQTRPIIESRYPYLLFEKNMFNSGFYIFSKNKTAKDQSEIIFYEHVNHFDQPEHVDDKIHTVKVNGEEAGYCADISDAEYSPAFEKKLSEMNYKPGMTVNASVKVYSSDKVSDSHLVLTIAKNDSTFVWLSAAIKNWITADSTWTSIYTSTDIPLQIDGDKTLKVFVWHRDKSHLLVDDLKVTLTKSIDYYKKGIRK